MYALDEQMALTSVSRRLVLLRAVMTLGLGLAIAVVHFALPIDLPLPPMATAVAAMALFNIQIWLRLRRGRAATTASILAQLLFDVAALTVLLYCAGGSANPFVSLYLLPLVVAAVVLPPRHAMFMALITVGCYSALMFWNMPLGAHHFRLHVIGMWCNFVLSAGLIVFFVVRMATALRSREQELAAERERALRDENIVALGTLAAGAAHELSTPLSTMAVLTRELEADAGPQQAEDMRCLREQVDACKTTLTRLRSYSVDGGAREAEPVASDALVRGIVDDWRLLRPAVPVTCQWRGPVPAPSVCRSEGLDQTLTNLINNAADASPAGMTVQGDLVDGDLVIDIQDSGTGVAADIAALARGAGRASAEAGEARGGMGLILANASVERLGGRIQWFDRAGGGVCARVAVPFQSLVPA